MSDRAVPVTDLVLEERCQCRATLSRDTVEQYAESYRAKTKMPPVDVYDVKGALVVVDGFHRVAGARLAGLTFLRARCVGMGTIDDAAWHALRANHTHGLRRTNEDKRRAVRLALDNPIGATLSDAVVAQQCGVSDWLVRSLREEVEAPRSEALGPEPEPSRSESLGPDDLSTRKDVGEEKRQGKDGKWYAPKRAAKPRREPEPEPVNEAPSPPPLPNGVPAADVFDATAELVRAARLAVQKLGRDYSTLPEMASQWAGQLDRVEQTIRLSAPIWNGREWTTRRQHEQAADRERAAK